MFQKTITPRLKHVIKDHDDHEETKRCLLKPDGGNNYTWTDRIEATLTDKRTL